MRVSSASRDFVARSLAGFLGVLSQLHSLAINCSQAVFLLTDLATCTVFLFSTCRPQTMFWLIRRKIPLVK